MMVYFLTKKGLILITGLSRFTAENPYKKMSHKKSPKTKFVKFQLFSILTDRLRALRQYSLLFCEAWNRCGVKNTRHT